MKSIFKSIIVTILTWEAKLILKKYKPKIVAVTGSVGKTSTKDAIAALLDNFYFVRKTKKSFNSDIGVPLTVLGVPNGWSDPFVWIKNIVEGLALIVLPNHYPAWLVLEVGADRPDDILKLSKWIIPDIVVVTRLSKVPVHVEFFSSPAQVFAEKGRLVEALKHDGTLVLNADDEDVLAFQNLAPEVTKILYGISDNADVVGFQYGIRYEEHTGDPQGIHFEANIGKKQVSIDIDDGLGKQMMYPALAALAVGTALKLDTKKMVKGLESFAGTVGRMRILPGIKNTVIIDDTYNSSPVALTEALNTLEAITSTHKKIAVLGDMLELGSYSIEEHKKAGEHAARVVDILITVGIRARGIADGALGAGVHESTIFQYESSREAGKFLESIMHSGDIVLVKGSQGVRTERVVEEIMREPQHKEKLLVRQDAEWSRR